MDFDYPDGEETEAQELRRKVDQEDEEEREVCRMDYCDDPAEDGGLCDFHGRHVPQHIPEDPDYGGAFDGFQVSSDADPGL